MVRIGADPVHANLNCILYDMTKWPITPKEYHPHFIRHCPGDGFIRIPK